jgi:hypothetical protein
VREPVAEGTAPLLDRQLEPPLADPSPSAVSEALRRAGIRACSFENVDAERPAASAPIATVRDALEAVESANPGYRWEITAEGLVDIFPVPSVLDESVPELRVAGRGLWRVLEEDVGLAKHGIELFGELRDGDGPPVPSDLPAGPLRSVLNRLIAPLPGTVWHIAGRPGAYFLTVSTIA